MEANTMPRRLAITGPHRVEVLEYQDLSLQPNQVLVKTELASGKHGTTLAFFDNRNLHDHRFDAEMRLFVETENKAEPPQPESSAPARTGTTGVGVIVEIGSEEVLAVLHKVSCKLDGDAKIVGHLRG